MNTPASPSAPKFISFEGTEGVGKTTAIDGFCQHLDALSIAHVRTREPGGSTLAEELREILLNKSSNIHNDTELLLMFAARSDHLHKVILPALADNKWVVCDRFIDSTVAYQGFGRHMGNPDELAKINELIKCFVPRLPDITFWLDIDPVIGIQRANKRSIADRFESLGDGFFYNSYQGFLYQYSKCTDRIIRVDANKTSEKIVEYICEILEI